MGEVVHFWSSERNSAAQYTNKATDQHKDKWGSKGKGKRVVFGHLFVMGRLTADLILKVPSFINCLKQRELDLRGLAILNRLLLTRKATKYLTLKTWARLRYVAFVSDCIDI